MQTKWIGSSGHLEVDVALDLKNAIVVIMFNDGVEKYAEIRDQRGTLLVRHSNTLSDRRPQTYVLGRGGVYFIRPRYRQSTDPASPILGTFQSVTDYINAGSSEVISHRDFVAVTPDLESVKVSITIILVDDDVRPDASLVNIQDSAKSTLAVDYYLTDAPQSA
jgi:hypothetical protein